MSTSVMTANIGVIAESTMHRAGEAFTYEPELHFFIRGRY